MWRRERSRQGDGFIVNLLFVVLSGGRGDMAEAKCLLAMKN